MDEDLGEFLESIGQLEPINAGQRFCSVCGTLVTLKNLQIIVPLEGGGFAFVCDRPECVADSEYQT
jgi:hypothetical protein